MATYKCGWCGLTYHDAHACHEEARAHKLLASIAEGLRFVADMLDRKACAFGEEPLSGALARLEGAREQLGTIVVRRDENVKRP